METVFDYDINDEEMGYLLISKNKKEYLQNTSHFKRYSDLYLLFKLRGESRKAEKFYNKLLNE